MEPILTTHARERLKERHGVKSQKKAQHICSNAYKRGVRSADTKGALRKWLDKRTRPGTELACYQDLLFIFSAKETAECITVINIPQPLRGNVRKYVVTA